MLHGLIIKPGIQYTFLVKVEDSSEVSSPEIIKTTASTPQHIYMFPCNHDITNDQ